MWTTCPICDGRGTEWYGTGHDAPTRSICYPCNGLGFCDWVEPAEPADAGADADLRIDEAVAAGWDRLAA